VFSTFGNLGLLFVIPLFRDQIKSSANGCKFIGPRLAKVSELSQKLGQLKMQAEDGKMRETYLHFSRSGKVIITGRAVHRASVLYASRMQ
jgi:hypothetical protein